MSEASRGKKETVDSPSARAQEKAIAARPSITLSRGIDSIFDDFRRSFDDFLAPFMPMRSFWPESPTGFPVRAPLVDIADRGDHYLVKAELPGFKKDMVDIELNNETLTIKAEKKADEKEEGEGFIHRERSYSVCQRTINFPQEVDPSKVDGTMVDGILEMKVSKKEPKAEERMRKIRLK